MLHLRSNCKDFEKERLLGSRKKGVDKSLFCCFSIKRICGYLAIFFVRVYQYTLRLFFPPSCRFHPSCSEYAIEAFDKFGLVKGGWLSIKRLCRCHPFNPGGFDPVP